MDDVLATGAKCLYRDHASGTDLIAHVVKVHYDDVPPYYAITIEGRDGERETIRSRLTPFAADARPLGAAPDSSSNALPPLHVMADTFKRELGLSASNMKALVDEACVELGVDQTNKTIMQAATAAWLAINGPSGGEAAGVTSTLPSQTAGPSDSAATSSSDPSHLLELLSISGAAESASRLFKDIDADGDGAVTRRELIQYFAAHGRDPAVAEALFAEIDVDSDGLIDYAEFKQLYQVCKRSADAEAKRQWRVLFVAAGGADELFNEIDSDRDGCLTRRELAEYLVARGGDGAMASRLLAAIDGDKDGLIDRTEMRNAMAWASTGDADAFALPEHGGSEGTAHANRALGGAFRTGGQSNAGDVH